MAKLRMLREMQLPYIHDAQFGYIDALDQPFQTISIAAISNVGLPPSVQWLTRHRQDLQELNIIVRHLVIFGVTAQSYLHSGTQLRPNGNRSPE